MQKINKAPSGGFTLMQLIGVLIAIGGVIAFIIGFLIWSGRLPNPFAPTPPVVTLPPGTSPPPPPALAWDVTFINPHPPGTCIGASVKSFEIAATTNITLAGVLTTVPVPGVGQLSGGGLIAFNPQLISTDPNTGRTTFLAGATGTGSTTITLRFTEQISPPGTGRDTKTIESPLYEVSTQCP